MLFVFEVRALWPLRLLDPGSFKPWHPFILWLNRLGIWLYRQAREIIILLPGAADHIAGKGVCA